jgi:hypothetical protein
MIFHVERKGNNALYDLWVIKWNSQEKKLKNSYPCNICLNKIKCTPQIKRVFYSDEFGQIISAKPSDMKFIFETHGQKMYRLGRYK